MVRKKHVWGLLVAAIVVPSCWQLICVLFDHQTLTELINGAGNWRVAVFLFAHTVAAAFGVPGTVLVVLGGALFGFAMGHSVVNPGSHNRGNSCILAGPLLTPRLV